MEPSKTDRGFEVIIHPKYLPPNENCRLVQQSSAVGNQPGELDHPGSSFLWVGERHHLNREEVRQLVAYLTRWLDTGSFTP